MKQKHNLIMRGSQGMLSDQIVFKRRKGVAILAAPPEIAEGKVPLPKQLVIQQKFKDASKYAKAAIKNPDTKAAYEARVQGLESAYNIAFADFYKAPVVSDLETNTYHGITGNIISVAAVDDFKVTRVVIAIHTGDGVLVEEGEAVMNIDELHWIYTATFDNPGAVGSKITATAFDLPGNSTALEAIA